MISLHAAMACSALVAALLRMQPCHLICIGDSVGAGVVGAGEVGAVSCASALAAPRATQTVVIRNAARIAASHGGSDSAHGRCCASEFCFTVAQAKRVRLRDRPDCPHLSEN